MADRNSAQNFSNIFVMLAKRLELQEHSLVESEIRRIAKEVWNISSNLDFSPEQMGCDFSLKQLGLFDEEKGYADYA